MLMFVSVGRARRREKVTGFWDNSRLTAQPLVIGSTREIPFPPRKRPGSGRLLGGNDTGESGLASYFAVCASRFRAPRRIPSIA